MTQDTLETVQLCVVVAHSPLAFIYKLFTPTVTINGRSYRRRWGTHFFDVPPGRYEVSISYPWLFTPECGKNTVQVEVLRDERKTVTYRAGLVRYLPGKMTVK